MKSRFLTLALAASAALLVLPVLAQKTQSADYVVAIVNSEPITNSEVQAAVQRVTEQIKAQRQPLPNNEELRQGVLERLISDRAQLQVAAETGIRIDDAAVDFAEQNLARQNQMEVDAFRQRLTKEGIPAEYATQLLAVINALNDMDQPVVSYDSGSRGIGVIVSDSMMFQREMPNRSDADLGAFYGVALPLIKAGVPLEMVQMENLPQANTLATCRVAVLTYEGQKPLKPATPWNY